MFKDTAAFFVFSTCLTTQLKFAAEAFIPECMMGGDVNERCNVQYEHEVQCPIFGATKHADPFVPKIKKKKKVKWIVFCFLPD